MSNDESRFLLKELAKNRARLLKTHDQQTQLANQLRPVDGKIATLLQKMADGYREIHDYLESRCG